MDKHAIPQNIMEVEFKLFGSLTVRQFISLAGGILIGVVIYFLKLPIIVGWPLIAFSVLVGLGLAFMTVNGQPFGRWFSNFIIALFSSQKYVWKKMPKTPKALKPTITTKAAPKDTAKTVLKKELGTIPIAEVVSSKNMELDEQEKSDLSRLDEYFNKEFEKHESSAPVKRVSMEAGNLAGENNPIGRGQRQVNVGGNTKVLYSQVNNQRVRPLGGKDRDIDEIIEEKIKKILTKQKDLDPYTKSENVEQEEQDIKEEMKRLYNEIQSLKKRNNG